MDKSEFSSAALAECEAKSVFAKRVEALPDKAWECSEWISLAAAPVASEHDCWNTQRAADGTAYFLRRFANPSAVSKAVWMTSGLGTYEIYVNGRRIGNDVLKPGFTHVLKTRRSFTYDITDIVAREQGAANSFAAEVSAGWWRDKIVNFTGRKSAFRGVIEFTFADGSRQLLGTKADEWLGLGCGPVTHAAIFDGEEYDARIASPAGNPGAYANAAPAGCVRNDEFKGEILPTAGAEICRRHDLAMKPAEAYCWQGVEGADPEKEIFGKVVRTRTFAQGERPILKAGETLVVDFGQNCAGVPCFRFKAAPCTVVTTRPGEMLNDMNGERSRGNDGPAGSLYRENLRIPETGMRATYTFADAPGWSSYMPRFTFFGYRYFSITATSDVEFDEILSVPVTSIAKELELGRIETGVADVNRLISNVYWGQLSNYLSVTTDCPQRNERLGWTADTQVFTEAGTFNADTSAFFHKWMRDMRDNQHEKGGFPGVAPFGQYGNEPMRLGWADAGVVVPFQIWKQFGDTAIIDENWDAMAKYVAHVNETKYDMAAVAGENGNYQWADWLSYEDLESCSGQAFTTVDGKWQPKPDAITYWNYLGACYWMWDADMMRTMAEATGRDASPYAKMRDDARAYLRDAFFKTADGLILERFRGMQTPALFALKLGLVEGEAKSATAEALRKNIADHGDCLQTGFLGASIIMDVLTENGLADVAYTLLLQHKNPSWLYSVDQGATTIWERWNSYRKDTGFGPVGMNSFNHYAYGSVLAWIYKSAAGIAADPAKPGFANIVMAPKPDKRLGFVKAEYKTRHGLVKSAWRYEGGKWLWDFTIPAGATASVTPPGASTATAYAAGDYHVEL